MEIRKIPLDQYGGAIDLKAWSDNYHAHYLLSGERFKENDVILDLMLKYGGACKLHEKSFSATDIKCNFDCMTCPHSIYHEIETRRKRFELQMREACLRAPREGDEWELSIVMRNPRLPKYETLFWTCQHSLKNTSIIKIVYETVMMIDPTFFDDAQLQYTKIARFDTARPLDVSCVANRLLREMHTSNTQPTSTEP